MVTYSLEPYYNTKDSKQKKFLSWQTWDLLRIMVNGFLGLCQVFTARHPGYFIVPVKINGSALETIFSQLKFRTGGNLSATNYASSLANLSTSREVAGGRKQDASYHADELYFRSHQPKRIRN